MELDKGEGLGRWHTNNQISRVMNRYDSVRIDMAVYGSWWEPRGI